MGKLPAREGDAASTNVIGYAEPTRHKAALSRPGAALRQPPASGWHWHDHAVPRLFGRRDNGLVHQDADIVWISFCRDQKTLLKKAQRLTRRDQRGISTDGFPFVGANGLQRRVKAVAYLIVRELGHWNS
jgi:hypothetical protein